MGILTEVSNLTAATDDLYKSIVVVGDHVAVLKGNALPTLNSLSERAKELEYSTELSQEKIKSLSLSTDQLKEIRNIQSEIDSKNIELQKQIQATLDVTSGTNTAYLEYRTSSIEKAAMELDQLKAQFDALIEPDTRTKSAQLTTDSSTTTTTTSKLDDMDKKLNQILSLLGQRDSDLVQQVMNELQLQAGRAN